MLAIVAVLGSWAALAAVLVGLGLGATRLAVRETPPLWSAFWVGLAAAIALLQAWHLFAPIDGRAVALLAVAALPGLARAELRAALPDRRLGAVLLLVALWLANRALGPPVGDAGLYHLSAVRWAREYSVVPGLANLTLQFGFNNASLLWTAACDVLLPGSHVSTSLLVAAVMLRGVVAVARLARGGGPGEAFWAVLLTPLAAQAVTLHELRISSPEPDTAMATVAMAAGGELVAILGQRSKARAFAAVVLAALAACIKASAAAFAAVFVAVVASTRQAPSAASAVAVAALVAPWVIRTVVLTGYPLYPLALGAVPVSWRVPADRVAALVNTIRTDFMPPVAWSMTAGGHWMRGWLAWQVTRCPELVILPLVAAAALAPLVRRQAVLRLLVPCGGALLAWTAAPSPRFGYAFLWLAVAALAVAYLEGKPARARGVALAAVAAALFPGAHRALAWTVAGEPARVAETFLLRPAPGLGFHPQPTAQLASVRTRSGLEVHIPTDRPAIWSAPLPAAVAPVETLALRRAPNLGAGFVDAR